MKIFRSIKTAPKVLLLAALLLTACGCGGETSSPAIPQEARSSDAETDSSSKETSPMPPAEASEDTQEAASSLSDTLTIQTKGGVSTAQFLAMDTVMEISLYGEETEEALRACALRIEELEQALSAEDENAELYQLNQSGFRSCGTDLIDLISKAQWMAEDTKGAFNIALYPLKCAWGFADQNYRVPGEEELQELLKLADPSAAEILELPASSWPNLPPENFGDGEGMTLQMGVRYKIEGMALDLGGIAKGYTADALIQVLERYDGVDAALVSLGGNVLTYGRKPDKKPWKIGVRDPKGEADYVGVVTIDISSTTDQPQSRAVVTSGTYERFFEKDGKRYHHILDPETGRPAESGIVSATIYAEDSALADMMSTAVLVLGKEGAFDLWRNSRFDFGMVLIDGDGRAYVSENMEDIFTSDLPTEIIS